MVSLDIILPCYNPIESWENSIINSYNEIQKLLPKTNISIILVNDGSTNLRTDQIELTLKNSIPNFYFITYRSNNGKGYALRKGVKTSIADFTIITDVDFPYLTESLISIYNNLSKGYNVVLGSRDNAYYKKTPLFRRVLSKSFRNILTKLFKLKTNDTQCGLKGFDRKGAELFLQTTIDRFLFDLEFVMLSSNQKNIKVTSVNVNLKEGISFSKVPLGILLTETINLVLLFFKKNRLG